MDKVEVLIVKNCSDASPSNIQIVELKLNLEGSKYLKSLIYGSANSEHVDGIHLRGPGASSHYTFRAIQAVKQALSPASSSNTLPEKQTKDNHTNCPQTKYRKSREDNYSAGGQSNTYTYTGRTFPSLQFRSQNQKGNRSYSDVVTQGPTHKTFRGENIFNHLNC